MNAELILGVDGGGTQTRALLADASGRLLGRGNAGSSNYHVVGLEAAGRALSEAIEDARRVAGRGRIAAAAFGLASVDRPSDQLLVNGWVARQGLTERFSVVNDSELVLAAGTPAGRGLALIGGTGSICIGRSPDGHEARAGGWGYLMGDEGGGYFLAVQALRMATQTADGRAEAHGILQLVLDEWGLDHADQLLGVVYQPETTHAEIAALADRVLESAEAGDPHARQLLASAALALARHVDIVARRLRMPEPPLAVGGGLLASSALLRQSLRASLTEPVGTMTVVEEPAQGALLIARRLLA
jgi:N-acetylglucosamine kinase-like BadF-type ATPase